MSMGGIWAQIALMSQQKPKKKCVRCGLHSNEEDENCPHCSHIENEQDLDVLKSKIEQEYKGNSRLGFYMMVIGVILFIVMIIVL